MILGPIGLAPDKLEDGGSLLALAQIGATRPTGSYQTATELLQVDLWQQWRNPTKGSQGNNPALADDALVESYPLPDQLVGAIHGARLPSAPQIVYGCLVHGALRLFERDASLVHHAITVAVHRQLVG